MRNALIVAAVGLGLAGLCAASEADAVIRKATDIPAQSLRTALQTLSMERDLQFIFRPDLVGAVETRRVAGNLTVEEALTQLLSGTQLTYKYLDEKTVTIVPATPPAADTRPRASNVDGQTTEASRKRSFLDRFRVAQAGAMSNEAGQTGTPEPAAAEGSEQALKEIVVTAQKREERLHDVPMSIVAMNADELRERSVTGVDDLAMIVPGMSASSNGGYSRQINLRGISNPVGSSSLIGVYLNEAAVTGGLISQLDLQTYDLERVEVLRGPQGTLYGDGSAGGTLRFITRAPVLDSFGGSASVEALQTQDGEAGGRLEGVMNIPLAADTLGVRIAGLYDREGGWIDQPAAGVEDFNGQDLIDFRITTLWRPSPQFTANLMAMVHRNDTASSNGEDDDGNYLQPFGLTTTPAVEDDYDLYNLTLTYDLNRARLLSSTSYLDHKIDVRNLGGLSQRAAPPAPPQTTYTPTDFRTQRGASQEVRLTSTADDPLQWTVGGYYKHERFSEDIPRRYRAAAGPSLPASFPPFTQDSLYESWAAFGDVSYDLTQRLTLGAGLRYFEEDQELDDGTALQSGTFHSTSPRIYARYEVSEAVNMYASAAKGFRSGGFNVAGQPPYDPEEILTYELGAKILLHDAHVSLDAAIFYSQYDNYQIFGNLPPPGPALAFFSNAGDARIEGMEWSLAWSPFPRWEFTFNGTYVDTEFVDINVVSSAYAEGDPVDMIPDYQVTASARRNFDWHGRAGFVRLDFSRQGRQTFRNRRTGPWFYDESDVIDLLNFNAGIELNKGLSLGFSGYNLLNNRGYTSPLAINGAAARLRPTTFGIELKVAF